MRLGHARIAVLPREFELPRVDKMDTAPEQNSAKDPWQACLFHFLCFAHRRRGPDSRPAPRPREYPQVQLQDLAGPDSELRTLALVFPPPHGLTARSPR